MTIARKVQINLENTTFYHCYSRCVRRAFLCGYDDLSKKNFTHRKEWIINRINQLRDVFPFKIMAYAIMDNHYHLVIHVSADEAEKWSIFDIINKWGKLFKLPYIVKKFISEGKVEHSEGITIFSLLKKWKDRLTNISWFMKCLNEYIARLANKEDDCSGRFWEGRFKSQALLDDQAVLNCMVYVDLNPLNTKNKKEKKSSHSSIQQRFIKKQDLMFPNIRITMLNSISSLNITDLDYIKILQLSRKLISNENTSNKALTSFLKKYNINISRWIFNITYFGEHFSCFFGHMHLIKKVTTSNNKKWVKNQKIMFSSYNDFMES